MMDRTTLQSLLVDACRAPSGDNAQPWRFCFDGTTLSVYNLPGIHNPHLDFEERGAYIAHGALLESVCIAAPHYGYEASVTVFPETKEEDLVATIVFTACEPRDDSLYSALPERVTNHHSFQNRPLSEEEQAKLEEVVATTLEVELVLVTDRSAMGAIARAASQVEIVILGDDSISSHFFSRMVWTQSEEEEKKSGFYVKTLEFNPLQHLVFWLASKPAILRLFRFIRLPQFIANQDARVYATGSFSGAVLVRNESAQQFVAAGRTLQRVWLTATALGLSFQPLIGMVFVAYRLESGRGTLSDEHATIMREAFSTTKQILHCTEKIPAVLFHSGVAPRPSVRTSRRAPNIEFV